MNKILLVEPNKILSKTYGLAFEAAGFEVKICQSAHSAIMATDQQFPDIVILELNMAGHNGVEFLYELRSYPEWQQIPVIINTMTSKEALNISESVWEDLKIYDFHYKPQTTLSDLIKSARLALAVHGTPT